MSSDTFDKRIARERADGWRVKEHSAQSSLRTLTRQPSACSRAIRLPNSLERTMGSSDSIEASDR
jgi:hypothetical protein